jgi:hypothetical protein
MSDLIVKWLKEWLVNDLYTYIMIYVIYSNRLSIWNSHTDCGEPPWCLFARIPLDECIAFRQRCSWRHTQACTPWTINHCRSTWDRIFLIVIQRIPENRKLQYPASVYCFTYGQAEEACGTRQREECLTLLTKVTFIFYHCTKHLPMYAGVHGCSHYLYGWVDAISWVGKREWISRVSHVCASAMNILTVAILVVISTMSGACAREWSRQCILAWLKVVC